MSRRASNNVRGPTSALTEFLREQGITSTLIAARANTREEEHFEAGPSNAANGDVTNQVEETTQEAVEYDSDNLDGENEEDEKPAKKRKLSKKEEEKMKAKEKAKARKNRKKKGDDDDDYSDGSEDDEYNALSRGASFNRTRAGLSGTAQPPIGSFEDCVKCGKQFTVTRYTMAAVPGPGWLCHLCAKASGADPFKKKSAPRQRKAPEEKRKIVNYEDREIPSLASLCIKVVSQHIDDVEALGDVGFTNRIEIGRALARNRSLTIDNAMLLYDVRNTELTIYDATKLGPNAFCTLASLNPALESLRVDFCGMINDIAIKFWGEHMLNLKRLELLGPFLVRPDGWTALFAACPQLTGLLITQSPRLDIECMESLAQYCTDLVELRLSQIGLMSDEFLGYVENFKNLTSLDLSEPSKSLGTEAVIALLNAVGSNLTHLNLSKNDLLTDEFVTEGLTPNVRVLTSLVLEELPEVTDAAMGDFFASTTNVPMRHVSLRRNHELADKTLVGLLSHSGFALEELDINSFKSTSNEALLSIGEQAKNLKKIDVGFCRQVDDFVVKALLDGCEGLKNISIFGCNKLTDNCPRKRGVSIFGIETHAV
ncbi:RNI-like protein [Fomitiporia mediterranea MF3/22]|uniref:RNI-like protein n=1 Tax=Fomitiporia mediterranea (strain MF3/22) TaxID=694068 RepID=UPI00044098DA|nr:RNI-like protein [Fomitiporia mediterranea MF3/22]EJD06146.1 RNI-like protein [Fomitiporia mediterranea MF3/22]